MSRLHDRRIYWAATAVAALLLVGWIWRAATTSRDPRSGQESIEPGESVDKEEINWPQLRGPSYDSNSLETGLADSWPEGGPPVLWTRELGQGYSGFCAVGNHVFTLSQSLYQMFVICMDAQTGKTVWTHHCGWPYEGGGLYPGPRSTPTWNDGRLYYATPDGTIGCLDAETGRPVWSTNPKKQHRGRGTDFGYACSPVVVDGRVIVPVGGIDAGVVALDARNGSEIWNSGESSASYATPLPIRWNRRSLVVTPLENSMAAFDVTSGKQEWELEFSHGYDEHSAAPIYREPYLFIASPFRAGADLYRLDIDESAIRARNDEAKDSNDQHGEASVHKSKAVLVWKSQRFSNDVASSVLVDGRIYGFDLKDPQSRLDRPSKGEFRCLDFKTGKVIWSTDQVGQANAIAADQKLILFTDRGELILARPGTDEYSELARTEVFRDEICWTYPALHRGCIYLRTQARAACVYLGSTPYVGRQPTQSVQNIPRGRSVDAKWLIGGEREFPATIPEWDEFLIWYEWSVGGLVAASIFAGLMMFLVWSIHRIKQKGHPVHQPAVTDDVAAGSNLSRTEMNSPAAPISANERSGTLVRIGRTTFWSVAALIAIVGSPVINAWQSEYVLLWPLALWIAFQMTVNVIAWTERQETRRSARWVSRGCGLAFIGICTLYFHLCRSAGYAIEWSFLVGILPGFPIAILAARFLTTRWRFWLVTDLLTATISFSACFWFSVIFIKWKLVVGS